MNWWQKEAVFLYYDMKCTVTAIAKACNVSKQAVSKFLIKNDKERYEKEKEERKLISLQKEKKRKRDWKRQNKSDTGNIDYEIIKRRHYTDVKILSVERH